MKSYMNASLLLVTGSLFAVSILTACAPLEAFKPEKPEVVEENGQLKVPQNVSEGLEELLTLAFEADPQAVFGDEAGADDVSLQDYVNLFGLTGQNVIQGISTQKIYRGNTRADGNGAEKFEVQVQILTRGVGLNRTLTYGGELMNSVDQRTLGFVELEKTSEDKNLSDYLDCLSRGDDVNAKMTSELRKKEAFGIQVLAACFDKTCDTVLLKLQLQNQGNPSLDSRVGISFEDRNTPGQKLKDKEVEMALVDASLKDLMSFSDAQDNRQVEGKLVPRCQQHIIEKESSDEATDGLTKEEDEGETANNDGRPD